MYTVKVIQNEGPELNKYSKSLQILKSISMNPLITVIVGFVFVEGWVGAGGSGGGGHAPHHCLQLSLSF